jgi:hypothetical protein
MIGSLLRQTPSLLEVSFQTLADFKFKLKSRSYSRSCVRTPSHLPTVLIGQIRNPNPAPKRKG